MNIKAAIRVKRAGKCRPVPRLITGPDEPLPQVCNQFITLDENKTDFARFLAENIIAAREGFAGERELVTSCGVSDEFTVLSNMQNVENLSSNHEVADTRIIVQTLDVIRQGYKRVFVKCVSALIFHAGSLGVEVWIVSGTSKNVNVNVSSTHDYKDPSRYANVLSFYAFTGCDTTYLGHGV